jgi:putative ABC transport system ATP-binding protein
MGKSGQGINTNNLNDNERAILNRDEIGFIFRSFNLLPNLNVLENVMLPMIIRDVGKAKELLEMVGIKEWDRFPRDLSFEEEQKIALARSLVNDPSLILALEPTGELDP